MRFSILLLATIATVSAAKPAHSYSDMIKCVAYLRITEAAERDDGHDEDAAYTRKLGLKLQKQAEFAAAKSGKAKSGVEADVVESKAWMQAKMVESEGWGKDAFVSLIENDCANVIGMD